MFTTKELFSKVLMIELPWFIEKMEFDQTQGKLDVWIDFARGSEFFFEDKALGISGKFKAYDSKVKTWRHMNFFQYQCYLHAKVPRVDLGNGKYRLVKTPWEGLSNGFTLLFEAMLMELVRLMPVRQVANLCSLSEHRLWALMKKYTTLARAQADFSTVTRIGVDETAARRGHDYVSLFVDVEEHRTLYVAKGRDHQVLQGFCADLHDHNASPEQIKQVSCDMSPAFIKGVQENLPEASIVFDRFHVVKIVNEAVDKVRKEEVRDNPLLKGSKYVFLSKPENLTDKQLAQLDDIRLSGLNLKTLKAYHIKESFQEIYTARSPRVFEKLLKKWYYWASHCRLTPMVKAAKTIKRHWDGIVNWATQKISNGILEGYNSIFQASKAKARGYKRFDTIQAIIYLLTGKLDFSKINPYCATHSF